MQWFFWWNQSSHNRYTGGAGGGYGGAALQAWDNNKGGTGGTAGVFPKFAGGYLPFYYVPAGYLLQIGGGAYATGCLVRSSVRIC